ncbi:hypothetical protein [Halobacterium litoreum]|uniref:5-methylcytosine-specific restriction enzyme subunit McrC n=1 Tax=Halobacterium litoreum TaxID=2039234 RepID=A0ABD5NIC3_9EURY|nr:hypothetical protein [Halobacterium litoreum]UHH12167.1 hypothetical protein LT972_08360 [Halobacterium litoreum]
MNREDLLDSLTSDVLTYVMHGRIPEEHLAAEIKPRGLDERFDDFESLVRLHFILRPDVVDFVEKLPSRIRSVKTQTKNVASVSRGTVDGRIDWGKTVQRRHTRNPSDRSLFVCEHRSENYDIDENVVLKKLLSVLYRTLGECREYFEREYEWVTDRWHENAELVDSMEQLFERNVHVRRIRSPESYEPTDRMIERASESRQAIYREASRLLVLYRETLNGESHAVRELLEKTAITPDDDETLFELYVLFRYIDAIEDISGDEFTLRTIRSGSQEVARLENDAGEELVLYHDSSARDRSLSFVSDVEEKDADTLSRTEKIQREARRVSNNYFQNVEFRTATGRPDVIVLEIDRGERTEYLITEVKHSTRPETIRTGVKETLEYLAFLRDDGDLVFEEPDVFGSGRNGVLVIQDLEETATTPPSDQQSIRILQASELDQELQSVIREIL